MAAPHVEFYTTDVPTAGSRVQIANTSRKVLKLWVKGHEGNAGNVVLGDNTVDLVPATAGWTMPNAVDAIPHFFDFSEAPPLQSIFYVDAAVSGDDVDTVFLLE